MSEATLWNRRSPCARTAADRAGAAARRPDRRGGARAERPSLDRAARLQGGQDGFVALFRYGVAVLVGLTPLEEDDVIRGLRQRVVGEFARHEEETAIIELLPEKDDQISAGRPDLRQGPFAGPPGRDRRRPLEEASSSPGTKRTRLPSSNRLNRSPAIWPKRAAARLAVAKSSSISVTRFWSGSGYRAALRSKRSPTCSGTVRIWSASMHDSRTNTN